MHSAIEVMLKKYEIKSVEDRKNALKEIIQEIALLGLFRSGFFNHAAFYGGTALRIFYGLDRFSEDMDFSLMNPDENFNLEKYIKYIRDELASFGFDFTVEHKKKTMNTNILSAFMKAETEILLLEITTGSGKINGVHPNEKTKIKLELDINPPSGADFTVKYLLNPIPFSVRLYSEESLFAGKLHAILCRKWKTRVKGRDFYDYIWYLSRGTKINLLHMENRMKQSGHLEKEITLDRITLLELLDERFSGVDFRQAKQDVLPFIKNKSSLELWSADFFRQITNDRLLIR